jgi:hypothetical protein
VTPRLRALLVFLAAALALGLLAGPTLLRPSRNNHFVHMAAGWLDGRLALPGDPPGYPRNHDDWGRVWTLQLRDGSTLRGDPCRTPACDQLRKRDGIETWRPTTGDPVQLPRRDILARSSTWYVTFPPTPAAVMLPGVALLGLAFPDVLLTVLAGALIPVLLLRLLDRVRPGHPREHLWAALAWTLASPACFVAAHGSVWFTAQILGALFLILHLDAAWDARQPARAGLWLALAVGCRVSLAFAIPFFLLEWWRHGHRPATLLRFLAPLATLGLAMAALNFLRFDDPLEFGHRYLDIRWQTRIQSIGMFSPHYLWRNLECMLWLVPQFTPACAGRSTAWASSSRPRGCSCSRAPASASRSARASPSPRSPSPSPSCSTRTAARSSSPTASPSTSSRSSSSSSSSAAAPVAAGSPRSCCSPP